MKQFDSLEENVKSVKFKNENKSELILFLIKYESLNDFDLENELD